MERKWKSQKGNIGDLMSTGLCILGMTTIMLCYLECTKYIQIKASASQLARKYILRMETVGHLTVTDQANLKQELIGIGVTNPTLTGTTTAPVGYGGEIVLSIQGLLDGEIAFEEYRESTAKY